MKVRPWLLFSLLGAGAFTLATVCQPRALAWAGEPEGADFLQLLLGDARRMLANQTFVEADVYFHSGYYPSVFDQGHAPTHTGHLTEPDSHAASGPTQHHPEEQDAAHEEEEHEQAMNFLASPLDWIEAFGRRFAITSHTHLSGGQAREILPWLRLSADLDPHRIETYTVAAFWLRRDLGKAREAEQFLREGLAANPNSYEIRFELGRLDDENYHDQERARNNLTAALRCWLATEAAKPNPDVLALGQIAVRLARIEEREGRYDKAMELLGLAIEHHGTPHPEALRAWIERLRARLK